MNKEIRRKGLSMLVSIFMVFLTVLQITSSQAKEGISAQQLLELAGADSAFKGLPQNFIGALEQLKQQQGNITPEFAEAWKSSVMASFKPNMLSSRVGDKLKDYFTPEEKKTLFEYFNSKFGKKVTALEKAAQAPQKQAEIMQKAAAILAEGKKQPDRIALYQSLDKALKLSETATALAVNSQIAMVIGMQAANTSPQKGPSFEQLRNAMLAQSGKIKAAVTNVLMVNFIYTYRSLTMPELKKYLAFLKSDAGQKFAFGLFKAQDSVLTDATHDFGKKLMKALGREPI